jgi:hypothetical protein
MAYDECHAKVSEVIAKHPVVWDFRNLKSIFFQWMFDFTCHKRIRRLFKDTQTGTRTKINSLTLINGAGIICWVFEFASAGSLVFR